MWNRLTVVSAPLYHRFLRQLTKCINLAHSLTYRRVFAALKRNGLATSSPVFASVGFRVSISRRQVSCAHADESSSDCGRVHFRTRIHKHLKDLTFPLDICPRICSPEHFPCPDNSPFLHGVGNPPPYNHAAIYIKRTCTKLIAVRVRNMG